MGDFTDTGYERTTDVEIIREKEEVYKYIFGIINNSVSDLQWQWLKNGVYERSEVETLIETSLEQMSISDGEGIFLNKHGIECGITRKGATKAQGYVEITRNISGVSFTVPEGTQFTSSTNTYEADEDTIVPYSVIMLKTATGESDDYFEASIYQVSQIEEIRDMQNNVIDPIYYTLDSVFLNNIQWTIGSSAVLVENEQYVVYLTGNVIRRVEVSSIATGPDANATIGTVTTCVQYPSLGVNNAEEIDGGSTQEVDSVYRTRLLGARRRTFTLGNIRSIVLETEGVRATKVYQDVGVDQHSVDDWDNPLGTGELIISGTIPIYSQSFVPGDQILTLGRITLYGDANNDPPALVCGVKRDIDEWGTGANSPYFDYDVIEKWDLDQSISGLRDIEFTVNYNGLDKTKTYRFDIFCDTPSDDNFDWSTNYWKIITTNEMYGTGGRKALYQLIGTSGFTGTWINMGDNIDLMFKTHFKGAGYTAIVATSDGYGFANVRQVITGQLDYVGAATNPGFSPICIQQQIVEADEIDIDLRVVVYISELADFTNVRRELEENVEEYLEGLDVGNNVVYSRIWQTIMDHEHVEKLEDLYIKREDETIYVQRDLGITDIEIPDLGTRTIQLGGVL